MKKACLTGAVIAACAVAGMVYYLVARPGSHEARNTPPASAAVQNDMVLVPAGFFQMGSQKGEKDEQPVHKLWIDSFYIDIYPVTNTQYGEFVKESGYEEPLYWNDPRCNHPHQPVVGVSWKDAMAYCQWRSKKENARISLPTEAQWEKAARGDDRRTYPWGNELPDKKRATTEITEKMPAVGMCELGRSPYGVSDLVGNVWNWCMDWYDRDYYQTAEKKNPQGPEKGKRKVVRGGNWVFLGCCSGTPAHALRATRRNSFHPSIRKKSIGFRCVKNTEAGEQRPDSLASRTSPELG
ncbi:MAG: formylglycine-generating enzyme family protein [Chitinispirillaceae bacterium]|nr:formylglycine-generating enzyme family protein [Chitinispirillaceae bacterium]